MDLKRISFLNTEINNLNLSEIFTYLDECIENKKSMHLVSLNVDQVVKIEHDSEFKDIVMNSELIITDGTPIVWISKLLGKPIVEKIPGPFLAEELMRYSANRRYSVFFLGAMDGVAELAACKMKEKYVGLNIVGTYSPPYGFENDKSELNKIVNLLRLSGADILIVGLSAPKQEKFVMQFRDLYKIPISLSLGAAIDFMAGNIQRAPIWVNKIGFEWLYRFFKEPKRLFKRYFYDDIEIVKLYFKYKGH